MYGNIVKFVIKWLIRWSGRAHYLSKRDRRSRFCRISNDLEEVVDADGADAIGLFTSKIEVLKHPRDVTLAVPF